MHLRMRCCDSIDVFQHQNRNSNWYRRFRQQSRRHVISDHLLQVATARGFRMGDKNPWLRGLSYPHSLQRSTKDKSCPGHQTQILRRLSLERTPLRLLQPRQLLHLHGPLRPLLLRPVLRPPNRHHGHRLGLLPPRNPQRGKHIRPLNTELHRRLRWSIQCYCALRVYDCHHTILSRIRAQLGGRYCLDGVLWLLLRDSRQLTRNHLRPSVNAE